MFHGSHIHNHAHSQHDLRDEDSVMNKVYKSENEKFPSIFVGIMAHASADGFAMGAALMDKVDSSVGMVIFLALILHKAPESFGLVTTLLQLRYSRRRIRRYLLVYAIAAPLGALLTNFVLRALFLLSSSGSNKGESINLAAVAGYMLLVSGGMLLNVALCHAFPEAMEQASMLSASCDSNNIDIAMSGIKQYETHQSDDTLASPHTVASGCVQPDNYFVSSQPRVDINEIGYGVETHLNSKNNTFGSRDFHNHHSNNLQTHQNHSYSHSHGHSHKLSTSQVVCLCVGVFLPALITLNHHH
ncbi:Zinc transporter ZIP9 [Zancudomyces culisetae]|uniref:Zinc transporter ZIP9 n=1 Tax=Zancudomyces culisetae TaxID=1213189 RepID=A0A1R1PZ21_ZANCU|nr:Zinc transporter ZIP9 [Zancudomyces culisetae]|eukprot:OMH86189.1 Zinc transporter ZIP9 [Zancudomyces culisetae]